MDEKLFIIG